MPRGIPNKPADEASTEAPKEKTAISKKIPVLTASGKAITKTEFGYDFENVHISADIPVNVLFLAFRETAGDNERSSKARSAIFEGEGWINEYALKDRKHRVRYLNGVINYGKESWSVPRVGPEVFLRVIADQLNSNGAIKTHFSGDEEWKLAKAKEGVKVAINALIGQ